MSDSAQFVIQNCAGTTGPVTVSASAIWLRLDPTGRTAFDEIPSEEAFTRIFFRSGRFYLGDLTDTVVVLLNGRSLETDAPEALASGDLARFEDTELEFELSGSRMSIAVQAVASSRKSANSAKDTAAAAVDASGTADALREFWEKRSRDKIARPSALHPQEPPRPGKARFSWGPTRDLAQPWPLAIFAWAAIVVTVIAVAAAVLYARAFSPGEIATPHARPAMERKTAPTMIAARANANSCTSCHALTKGMNAQCATCHQTPAFASAATGIDAHIKAGIGCTDCHTEHNGADFADVNAALNSCATCHNSANPRTFGGRQLSTPHGGTTGYPVVNGVWKWEGLTPAEWAGKPDAGSAGLHSAAQRLPQERDDDWWRRQFHALHLNRVTLGNSGLPGDAKGLLSCSSCHRSLAPTDQVTPATTCTKCHNGDNGRLDAAGRSVLPPKAANCVSCHVQHAKQPDHWNAKLFKPAP
ncbi:MAG: hypothetical protein ABIP75_20345 [Pyrinomonadaceae bacterium]